MSGDRSVAAGGVSAAPVRAAPMKIAEPTASAIPMGSSFLMFMCVPFPSPKENRNVAKMIPHGPSAEKNRGVAKMAGAGASIRFKERMPTTGIALLSRPRCQLRLRLR